MRRTILLFAAAAIAALGASAGDQFTSCHFDHVSVKADTAGRVYYSIAGGCATTTKTTASNHGLIIKASWDPATGIFDENFGPDDWTVKSRTKCTRDPYFVDASETVVCTTLSVSSPKYPDDYFAQPPLGMQIIGYKERAILGPARQAALAHPDGGPPPPPAALAAVAPNIVSPAAGKSFRSDETFNVVIAPGNALNVTKFDFQIEKLTSAGKWVQVFVQPMNTLNPLFDTTKNAGGVAIPMSQFDTATKIRLRARNSGIPGGPWSEWREVGRVLLVNLTAFLAADVVQPSENQVVTEPVTVKVLANGETNVELAFARITPASGSFPAGSTPISAISKVWPAGDADGYTFHAGTFPKGHYRVTARQPGKAWSGPRNFEVK